MAVEAPTQKQTAEKAASVVVETSKQERVDAELKANAKLRLDRANDRAIKSANQENPLQGLRALASGERGEVLRGGQDWKDAKAIVEERLKIFKDRESQVIPQGFYGSFTEGVKASYIASDALGGDFRENVANVWRYAGGDFKDALVAGGDLLKAQMDAFKARRELRSFVNKNKDVIALEEQRLIRAKVEDTQSPLDAKGLKDTRDEAILNVRIAIVFEEMQKGKVVDAIKSDLDIQRQVAEAIGIEQSRKKRVLTNAEIENVSNSIINPLTEKAMSSIRAEASEPADEVEQKAIEHGSFDANIVRALGEMNPPVRLQDATPEQIERARVRAVDLTRDAMNSESVDSDSEAARALDELRASTEWQSAYSGFLKAKMLEGVAITSGVRIKLQEAADTVVGDKQKERAEAEEGKKKAEAEKTAQAELTQARADADKARWDAARLRARAVIARARAEAITKREQAEKSGLEADQKAAKAAEENVDRQLKEYVESSVRARQDADANPGDQGLRRRADAAEADLQMANQANEQALISKDAAEAVSNAIAEETNSNNAKNRVDAAELKVQVLDKSHISADAFDQNISELDQKEQVDLGVALGNNTPQERADALQKFIDSKKGVLALGALSLLIAILKGITDSIVEDVVPNNK